MGPGPEKKRRWFLPARGLFLTVAVMVFPLAMGCARVYPPEPTSSTAPKSPDPGQEQAVTDQKQGPKEPPLLRRDKPPGPSGKKGEKRQEFWVRVLRVIDGVTFSLDNHQVVRLIGVASPSQSTQMSYRKFFKRVTTPAVRDLVEGKRVRLMRDKVVEGRNRVTLIYLFLEDNSMLNATLIQKGYGRLSREIPFKFQDEFRLWEREAQDIGLGLWARIGSN
ncbi:MAG: thermonuclease family protein [Nitrospinota bacterium]